MRDATTPKSARRPRRGGVSRGAIEVRLLPDRLVVTNPGGLHGLTVERLGQPDATSARNARLVEICRYVRTPSDSRVVELLATGIATVRRAVADAGLPGPQFIDKGIAFSAILPGMPPARVGPPASSRDDLTPVEREVLAELVLPVTVADLVSRTGKSAPALRKTLRALRDGSGSSRPSGPTTREIAYGSQKVPSAARVAWADAMDSGDVVCVPMTIAGVTSMSSTVGSRSTTAPAGLVRVVGRKPIAQAVSATSHRLRLVDMVAKAVFTER